MRIFLASAVACILKVRKVRTVTQCSLRFERAGKYFAQIILVKLNLSLQIAQTCCVINIIHIQHDVSSLWITETPPTAKNLTCNAYFIIYLLLLFLQHKNLYVGNILTKICLMSGLSIYSRASATGGKIALSYIFSYPTC